MLGLWPAALITNSIGRTTMHPIPASPGPRPDAAERQRLQCSFCGRTADQTRFLSAGVFGGMICDRCCFTAAGLFAGARLRWVFARILRTPLFS
jgi:hypothetical protein